MKFKKKLVFMLAVCFCLSGTMNTVAWADDDDDLRPRSITAVEKSKTVYVGKEFEVKVRTKPIDADDDALKWTIIKGRDVVRFDDDDRYDDEVELKAIKAGSAVVQCRIIGTKKYANVSVTVKKAPDSSNSKTITRVGKAQRTVEVGDDFELEVRKAKGVKESDLKWTIQNSKIVRFEDDSKGDDVELEARKTGTTKVICKNKNTNQSIIYTVNVIPDDDYDDDDYDDDDYDDDDYDDDDYDDDDYDD